jgi:hypothetical protein
MLRHSRFSEGTIGLGWLTPPSSQNYDWTPPHSLADEVNLIATTRLDS